MGKTGDEVMFLFYFGPAPNWSCHDQSWTQHFYEKHYNPLNMSAQWCLLLFCAMYSNTILGLQQEVQLHWNAKLVADFVFWWLIII